MPRGEQTHPETNPPPTPPPPPRGEQTAPQPALTPRPATPAGRSGLWDDLFNNLTSSSDPLSALLQHLMAPLAEGTYSVTGGFGDTHGPYPDTGHIGVDFGTGGKSVPILAPLRGTVIDNGWSDGYGWYMKIQHPDGTVTLYAHMAGRSPYKVGMPVGDREQIGMTGTTGHSTGIHLHFEVYDPNGNRYDPMAWLEGKAPGDYQTNPTVKYAFKPSGPPVDRPSEVKLVPGLRHLPGSQGPRGEGAFNPYASIFGNSRMAFDPVQSILGGMGLGTSMEGGTFDPVQSILTDLGVAV